jgi:cation-transporting ATPase F
MQLSTEHQWHNLPSEETVRLLQSDTEEGLDEQEVKQRLGQFGSNRITTRRPESPFIRFLRQFHQPLIYILIGSGIITALLGEWVDSAVIFGVVLANAITGYIQEAKALDALAALAKTMVSEATVIRQGIKTRVSSSAVIPGDIVLLQAGDKIPADLRLVTAKGLQVDESALTGESIPVDKSTSVLDSDTELPSRRNMAYASTLVTHGQAKGIVIATGDRTEVGRISQLISTAQELATPLTRKIDHFSQLLLYAILSLTAVTVLVGMVRGQPLFDMFMAAVALAVGAIPEGLPAAVTITLAIGVSRMARRKAIIRKLPAVETLGSTTVICTDKTGTLTENKMTVQAIIAGDNHFAVTGTGYNPSQGQVLRNNNPPDLSEHPALKECLQAGLLCNDSVLSKKNDAWFVEGDPTEGALLVSAAKAGLHFSQIQKKYRLVDSVPFESLHQFMACLFINSENHRQKIYVKGGLEVILSGCTSRLNDSGEMIPLDKEKLFKQAEDLASKGLRILAFAGKADAENIKSIDSDTALSGLTFLGLQGMIDPPRDEAVQAVRVCYDAGITVKMITGDHALTAQAIARQVGIGNPPGKNNGKMTVLTGRQLDKISDQELIAVARDTDVFARTTPEQKLRLVKALQSQNQIVAMTGDGVNDAPALKQADIGVAMGISGTEVAKDAADMVLTDDNFNSIKAAVEEGRGVFDNLTKFIVWTLPTNLGEGLVIMVAIFLGITLPILPVQILWINMTTAGFLGLMLAFEPKEPGIMLRQPRDPQKPLLTNVLISRIILVGFLLLIFTFLLFKIELSRGVSIEKARTVAVNTFVVIELCYLFNCRSLSRSIFSLGLFSNLWVIGGAAVMLSFQVGYTYLPFMNYLFESSPISFRSWLYILCAGIVSSLIVEGEKRMRQINMKERRIT